MSDPSSRRPRWVAGGSVGRFFAATFFAAYAVSVFIPGRPWVIAWVQDLTTIIVPAVCAVAVARNARHAAEARVTWWLFAAGALSWAIGDTIFTVLDHIGGSPATSLTWADAFYLALVPLWAAALIAHPGRSGRTLERAGGTLDMAVVLVGAGGIAWAFVVQPLAQGTHGLTSVVAAVIYPVSDLALLTAFGALLLRTRMNLRRSDMLIGAGAFIFALSDLTYARLALSDSYKVGSPVDLMFEAGFLAVAAASVLARRRGADETKSRAPAGAFTGAFAIAGLVGTVSVALASHRSVVSGAAMVMGVLIAARQTLLLADRRKLMVALEEARRAAEDANNAKTEFITHMSHEIGTPLSSVLGYAQLLEVQSEDENIREYARRIQSSGNHLNDLVSESLDISRIEQGQLGMSLEPVGLLELAKASLDVMRPIAEAARIMMTLDPDVDAGAFVLADHQRLKQVLINLLSNGVKHNRDDGHVVLSWSRLPDDLQRVSVTDTGPGIAPEAIDRLFIPFERLGGSTSAKGTGLGLAVSKRMTEAMGGAIGVSSTVGEGSTFWIDLPYAASLQPQETNGEQDLPDIGGHSRTIVYIEDNVSNLELVEEIMRDRGVTIIPAMQGQLGVELALEHQPDVILLDRHLPDTSAEVVLARLKASPQTRHIPVVVLSAEAASRDFEPLIAGGARAYLTKPIDVNRFQGLMENLFTQAA